MRRSCDCGGRLSPPYCHQSTVVDKVDKNLLLQTEAKLCDMLIRPVAAGAEADGVLARFEHAAETEHRAALLLKEVSDA